MKGLSSTACASCMNGVSVSRDTLALMAWSFPLTTQYNSLGPAVSEGQGHLCIVWQGLVGGSAPCASPERPLRAAAASAGSASAGASPAA